jgi:Zn-dependent protease with chaperone function
MGDARERIMEGAMDHQKRLTHGTLKIAGLAIVALFLVPVLTLALSSQIFSQWDQNFSAAVLQKAGAQNRVGAEAYIALAKPSELCASTHPELAKSKSKECFPMSDLWQVTMARSVALGAIASGGALLLLVLLLSLAAFGSRGIQYLSFAAGKQLMVWASAAEILAQGAMLVWLSYWVTAFFFNVYIVKLIAGVAILVGLAALAAIAGIFRRSSAVNSQHGELVREADAPLLWARIRQLAERLKTAPPKQIVAGIDANFYVTEAPLKVGDDVLNGRTLYMSLPLLRKLETSEADAVLAHELAHLSGGDTANSARLGPALQHYDQYCSAMRAGGATAVVWPVLALYRIIFELALARSRRSREFRADKVAAELVSPADIGKSLVKVAAYSIYRAKLEGELFEQTTLHTGELGIASAIDNGLAGYVQSPAFVEKISSVQIPHPFDSHPPLEERMRAVGVTLRSDSYAAIAMQAPASTWVSDINPADAIEARLWSAFDEAFAAQHERMLAYRYQPTNEEERALILKYFPTREFTLKNKAVIEISYRGIRSTEVSSPIPWDVVKTVTFRSSSFIDRLAVGVVDFEKAGKRTVNIRLSRMGKQKGELQAVLAAYWRRHQIMKQLQT